MVWFQDYNHPSLPHSKLTKFYCPSGIILESKKRTLRACKQRAITVNSAIFACKQRTVTANSAIFACKQRNVIKKNVTANNAIFPC